MAVELPEQLKHDINAALTILMSRCPGKAYQIEHFRRASKIKGSIPLLYKRFHNLVGNALGGPERYDFTEEEKHEIGQLLLSLSEMNEIGRPGPKSRGNEYRLMCYLTDEEHSRLTEYCERENITRAEAVRRGIRALTV